MQQLIEQPIKYKKEFLDFYTANNNWLDEPGIDVLGMLRSFYPQYFQANGCDYELLRKDILEFSSKSSNKAYDLFKSLFKVPFRALNSVSTLELTQIEKEFGNKIFAHGVSEDKGGMYNLLLMCISNEVHAPSNYWGFFVTGMPNISPVVHGPYYLIYAMPNQKLPQPNNPLLTDIARILIPFPENRVILIEKLDAMLRVGLITSEAKDAFIKKLTTYSEFLNELRIVAKSKTLIESQKFFGVTYSVDSNEQATVYSI